LGDIRCAAQDGLGDLECMGAGARVGQRFGAAVAAIGELAAVAYDPADRVGEFRALGSVDHYVGDGGLAGGAA